MRLRVSERERKNEERKERKRETPTNVTVACKIFKLYKYNREKQNTQQPSERSYRPACIHKNTYIHTQNYMCACMYIVLGCSVKTGDVLVASKSNKKITS